VYILGVSEPADIDEIILTQPRITRYLSEPTIKPAICENSKNSMKYQVKNHVKNNNLLLNYLILKWVKNHVILFLAKPPPYIDELCCC